MCGGGGWGGLTSILSALYPRPKLPLWYNNYFFGPLGSSLTDPQIITYNK